MMEAGSWRFWTVGGAEGTFNINDGERPTVTSYWEKKLNAHESQKSYTSSGGSAKRQSENHLEDHT